MTIPISCKIFKNISKENYFWRIPNDFKNEDNLKKTRELWIKIPETNYFYKIELIFKIDYLSNIIKTCQLNSLLLFKKRERIFEKLQEKNIDIKLIKQFIRHDYLGNIYCYSDDDYIDFLIKNNKKIKEYLNYDFVKIMKIFVDNIIYVICLILYLFIIR